MYMSKPILVEAEVIKTPDGVLMPVYKDWEEWHGGYEVKMVYCTTIAPNTSKGPILHEQRRGLMTCIQGDVSVTCLVDGVLQNFKLTDKAKKYTLIIPKNMPNLITNHSTDTEAILLNLPDRSWHPEDQDTQKFLSWEDYFKKQNTSTAVEK